MILSRGTDDKPHNTILSVKASRGEDFEQHYLVLGNNLSCTRASIGSVSSTCRKLSYQKKCGLIEVVGTAVLTCGLKTELAVADKHIK